jgi:hypothetical protein
MGTIPVTPRPSPLSLAVFCLAALLMPPLVTVLDQAGSLRSLNWGNMDWGMSLGEFRLGPAMAFGSAALALVRPRLAWLSALLSLFAAVLVVLITSAASSPETVPLLLLGAPFIVMAVAPWIFGGALFGAVPMIMTRIAGGKGEGRRP